MSSSDDVQSARDQLAAGHHRRSLAAAWRAADSALREADVEAINAVLVIAQELKGGPDPRVARDAQTLALYCTATLDGAGGGVESHTILSRISRLRRPRRACPDCAEQIPVQARVCRYCGFRLEPQ